MEIGDKTQLAVLSLTARTGRTTTVFAGATLALAAVTLLGVVVGAILGEFIPLAWVSRLAGAAFLGIGGVILWSNRPGTLSDNGQEETRLASPPKGSLRILALTFGLLFLAEMGDKSQLAVVTLAARTGSPVAVFLGAVLALSLVTLLGALAGKAVARLMPVQWVSIGAGLLFVIIGILTLADVL